MSGYFEDIAHSVVIENKEISHLLSDYGLSWLSYMNNIAYFLMLLWGIFVINRTYNITVLKSCIVVFSPLVVIYLLSYLIVGIFN